MSPDVSDEEKIEVQEEVRAALSETIFAKGFDGLISGNSEGVLNIAEDVYEDKAKASSQAQVNAFAMS